MLWINRLWASLWTAELATAGRESDGGRMTNEPPPTRCPRHLDDPAIGPCPACRDAREWHEEWRRREAERDREEASAAARERARIEAADARRCGLCNGTGYYGIRVCHHRADQDEINRRGVELVRAELVAARRARHETEA